MYYHYNDYYMDVVLIGLALGWRVPETNCIISCNSTSSMSPGSLWSGATPSSFERLASISKTCVAISSISFGSIVFPGQKPGSSTSCGSFFCFLRFWGPLLPLWLLGLIFWVDCKQASEQSAGVCRMALTPVLRPSQFIRTPIEGRLKQNQQQDVQTPNSLRKVKGIWENIYFHFYLSLWTCISGPGCRARNQHTNHPPSWSPRFRFSRFFSDDFSFFNRTKKPKRILGTLRGIKAHYWQDERIHVWIVVHYLDFYSALSLRLLSDFRFRRHKNKKGKAWRGIQFNGTAITLVNVPILSITLTDLKLFIFRAGIIETLHLQSTFTPYEKYHSRRLGALNMAFFVASFFPQLTHSHAPSLIILMMDLCNCCYVSCFRRGRTLSRPTNFSVAFILHIDEFAVSVLWEHDNDQRWNSGGYTTAPV